MQKKVVITGGNRGIGLELTRSFLELDYDVVVIARDFEEFEFRDVVECVVFDLCEPKKIAELVSKIGVIDILINNAGIMYGISHQEYDSVKKDNIMKINLEAPIKLIEEFSKTMPKGSRIVNNASIAGQIGHPDIWYGMSKAALINATKSFSKIFEGDIIINAVAASPVETDMLQTIPKPRREAFLANTITKRFASSQDVAKTIFWLATDAPEYMNGTCIDVNNGSFAR
ncbi:SDR family oxidoreductase [Sulfurimonas sp.]